MTNHLCHFTAFQIVFFTNYALTFEQVPRTTWYRKQAYCSIIRGYLRKKAKSQNCSFHRPKQNAKTASFFSLSQPVCAHVIVPPPAAGLARKQLVAITGALCFGRNKTVSKTVLKRFYLSFVSVLYFHCADSLKPIKTIRQPSHCSPLALHVLVFPFNSIAFVQIRKQTYRANTISKDGSIQRAQLTSIVYRCFTRPRFVFS